MNYLITLNGDKGSEVHSPVSNTALINSFPEVLKTINPALDFVCMFNAGPWQELNAVFLNRDFQEKLDALTKNKVLFIHLMASHEKESKERYADYGRIELTSGMKPSFWKEFVKKNFKQRNGDQVEEMLTFLSMPSVVIFRLYKTNSLEDIFIQPLAIDAGVGPIKSKPKVDELFEATLEFFTLLNDHILIQEKRWDEAKVASDFKHEWTDPMLNNASKAGPLFKLLTHAGQFFFGVASS